MSHFSWLLTAINSVVLFSSDGFSAEFIPEPILECAQIELIVVKLLRLLSFKSRRRGRSIKASLPSNHIVYVAKDMSIAM